LHIRPTISLTALLAGFSWSDLVSLNTDVSDSTKILDNLGIPLKVLIKAKTNDLGLFTAFRLHATSFLTPMWHSFAGIKKVSFYSEFWLINKTGLRLLYRQAVLSGTTLAPGQRDVADDKIWDLHGMTPFLW